MKIITISLLILTSLNSSIPSTYTNQIRLVLLLLMILISMHYSIKVSNNTLRLSLNIISGVILAFTSIYGLVNQTSNLVLAISYYSAYYIVIFLLLKQILNQPKKES